MERAKSILIVGGSGFVGSRLALRLRSRFKVYLTYRSHPIRLDRIISVPFNVMDQDTARRLVYMIQPDVIIYTAGTHQVEIPEKELRAAESINTSGPASLLNAAQIFQPRFIYLSNSYVFDGLRGNYHETDTVIPINTLGRLKVGGENLVKGKSLNYSIIRCSPLLGVSLGSNLTFVDQLRWNLASGKRFEALNSELQSFTAVETLIDLIDRVINSGPRNKTFHVSGLTKVTQFELAKRLADRLKLPADLIVPISRPVAMMSRKAAGISSQLEVQDYSLNSTQSVQLLKVQPLFLEQSLDLIEKELIVPSMTA